MIPERRTMSDRGPVRVPRPAEYNGPFRAVRHGTGTEVHIGEGWVVLGDANIWFTDDVASTFYTSSTTMEITPGASFEGWIAMFCAPHPATGCPAITLITTISPNGYTTSGALYGAEMTIAYCLTDSAGAVRVLKQWRACDIYVPVFIATDGTYRAGWKYPYRPYGGSSP